MKSFIQFIIFILLLGLTANVYSYSHVYIFESMAQSNNVGIVNVINKQPLFTKDGFSCGYSYSFDTVDSYKGNVESNDFWSMRDEIDNSSYVVFLENSKYVLNFRIEQALSKELSQEDKKFLTSFKKCEAIIPKFGLSADGSGIFKLIKVKDFESIINPKTRLFVYSKSALKSCDFENGYSEKLIPLSCFKKLIVN